jgi:beta-mannosidase
LHEGQPFDDVYTAQAIFQGEFGFPSYPCYESVQRFLPEEERDLWPAPADKSFAYHTPSVGGEGETMEYFAKSMQYFTIRRNMQDFILDSQLTQGLLVRHMVERSRTRWPESTGTLYFIFNDSAPAASLSTVDWYGAPKISYYLIQSSYAPLLAVGLFPKATTQGAPLTVPVYLLDDANALSASTWEVAIRAYGADLRKLKEIRFFGTGTISNVKKLGEFALSAEQTQTSPLLTVTDVIKNGALAKRHWYFTNVQRARGCLFSLPKTRLSLQVGDGLAVVRNVGPCPAVGASVLRPGYLDTFSAGENYFWLEPGDVKSVSVSSTVGITADAWNAESI